MDQLSCNTGPELLQATGFCDVSLDLIPIPDVSWKYCIEMDTLGKALSGYLLCCRLASSSRRSQFVNPCWILKRGVRSGSVSHILEALPGNVLHHSFDASRCVGCLISAHIAGA